MNTDNQLLIGQLARAAGVKTDTVRFYERDSLLAKPERTFAGYRVFDPATVNQLRLYALVDWMVRPARTRQIRR